MLKEISGGVLSGISACLLALTILGNAETFLLLAGWVHHFISVWREWLEAFWAPISKLIGYEIPPSFRSGATISFLCVSLATGAKLAETQKDVQADETVRFHAREIPYRRVFINFGVLSLAGVVVSYWLLLSCSLAIPNYIQLVLFAASLFAASGWGRLMRGLPILLFIALVGFFSSSGKGASFSIPLSDLDLKSIDISRSSEYYFATIGNTFMLFGVLVMVFANGSAMRRRIWSVFAVMAVLVVMSEVSKLGLKLEPPPRT